MSTKIGKSPTRPTYRGLYAIRKGLLLGDVLLSQAVTSQVPSTLKGLTSVFGMVTGVSLLLLSPYYLFISLF